MLYDQTGLETASDALWCQAVLMPWMNEGVTRAFDLSIPNAVSYRLLSQKSKNGNTNTFDFRKMQMQRQLTGAETLLLGSEKKSGVRRSRCVDVLLTRFTGGITCYSRIENDQRSVMAYGSITGNGVSNLARIDGNLNLNPFT